MKNLKTIISVFLFALFAFACSDEDDTQRTIDDEPAFALVTEHEITDIESFSNNAITVFRDSIVSVGGFTFGNHSQGQYTGQAHSYENNGLWTQRFDQLPKFWNKEAEVFNNRLFILGETIFDSFPSQNVIYYSDDMDNWDFYQTNMPVFQYASTIVWNNQLLMLGFPGAGNDVMQAWTSTDGENWNNIATDLPMKKQGELISYNNELVWIGGTTTNGDHTNEIWTSNDGISWSELQSNAPDILGHQLEVYNGRLFIVGGFTNNLKTGIWHTTNLTEWTNVFPAEDDSKYIIGHSTVLYHGKIYILGGFRVDGVTGDAVLSGEITTFTEL